MPERDTEDVFITPEELITRYKGRISIKTLANWRTKGGGPDYTKIGGKIMYRLSAITDWEKLRTFASTAKRIAGIAMLTLLSLPLPPTA